MRHRPFRCRGLPLVIPLMAARVLAGSPPGPTSAASGSGVVRVGGVISANATWSGTILITEPTQIDGATVTVAPGTTIEFVTNAGPEGGKLLVGSVRRGGRLELAGEAGRPITLRCRPDGSRGRVVVRTMRGQAVRWAHVRFEGLGWPEKRGFEPAVSVVADAPGAGLVAEDCSFTGCARLHVQATEALSGALRRCTFERGVERLDLAADGADGGSIVMEGSRFDGVVHLAGLQGQVRDNLFVGSRTALIVDSPGDRPSTIVGNYIHNTTEADDGSFCLQCRDAGADIRDNVLCGGTYVILEGSRRIRGNVLVAAPRLTGPIPSAARTHYLIADVPARSRVEDNLLIGPAYALLATQAAHPPSSGAGHPEQIRGVTIEGNVFDGAGNTGQAIRLNVFAREAVGATIRKNTFLSLSMLVLDEARVPGSVAFVDGNTVVGPRPSRFYEGVVMNGRQQGDKGFGAEDRVVENARILGLSLPLGERPPDWDAELQAGTSTIARLRQRVRAAYGKR